MYTQILITKNTSKNNCIKDKSQAKFWCLLLNHRGYFEYLCKTLDVNGDGNSFKTLREALMFVKKRFIVKRHRVHKNNVFNNKDEYYDQVFVSIIKDLRYD